MVKMGRMAVGAIGGLTAMGNSAQQVNRPIGGSIAGTLNRNLDSGYTNAAQSLSEQSYKSAYLTNEDPLWTARQAARRPIEDKIKEWQKTIRWRASQYINITHSLHLHTLQSTSLSWRAGVVLDHYKKQQTLMETLESQLRAIMDAPMDKLQEIAGQALAALMRELGK